MDIIQRDNKYFLQLANGELELSEQQVKKRVERGDRLHEYLQKLESKEPHAPTVEEAPKSAQSFITSGKYFDNLIREFEQIYRVSEDKEEAAEKLIRFCQNAINKLHTDRKNPKTDHVVIDYYILSWSRVVSFIQSLSNQPAETPATSIIEQQAIAQPHLPEPKDILRQVLIIQLLQADGLFPISDALQGVTAADLSKLISAVTNAGQEAVDKAILESSSILLKRGITRENQQERIQLLEDLDTCFEQLPYANILSRIKLLLKIYREQALP